MKFLLSLFIGATALILSVTVAFASGGFHITATHGIGLLYHGCFMECQPDADVTITNNSPQRLYLSLNGHHVIVQPHHDMEVSL